MLLAALWMGRSHSRGCPDLVPSRELSAPSVPKSVLASTGVSSHMWLLSARNCG